MKRLITTVLAATASFAMISTPALAAGHPATSHNFASCRAQGDFATCDASGTAHRPLTIRVHVSSSPSQSVLVSWDMTCSKGSGAGGRSGQFTATTPVNRVIHHPYRHPDVCYVAAGAQLNGSGHLHVWLTYTR